MRLFQDTQGLVRSRGRFERAELEYDAKCPLLLPEDHRLTLLLIRKAHEEVYHNGVRETLVQLRSRYWVLIGRQAVKKEIHRCNVCRKIEGRPYKGGETAQLPEFRVTKSEPFSTTWVDFTGPLFTKERKIQQVEKVYIALFTCAASRMIHLELVADLTSEAFIRSFKRFMSRKGIPKRVISDNGKTFKAKDVQKFVSEKGIKWLFNLVKAKMVGRHL